MAEQLFLMIQVAEEVTVVDLIGEVEAVDLIDVVVEDEEAVALSDEVEVASVAGVAEEEVGVEVVVQEKLTLSLIGTQEFLLEKEKMRLYVPAIWLQELLCMARRKLK